MHPPFNQLDFPPLSDWKRFEYLVNDLIAGELKNGTVQRHGREGQKQFGVDIHGLLPSGGILGAQCKKKDALTGQIFTTDELHREVEKAKRYVPALERYQIYHSGPDDGLVQREAFKITQSHRSLGLFTVQVFGWYSIRDRLSSHPSVTQTYYSYPPVLGGMRRALNSGIFQDRVTQNRRFKLVALQPGVQNAFALLAAIQIPFTRSMLEELFPSLEWQKSIRYLIKAKQLTNSIAGYIVPQVLAKAFFKEPGDRRQYDEAWVEALQPYRFHIDTGIILLMEYAKLLRFDDFFELLKMLTEIVEPGYWTGQLLQLLSAVCHDQHLRKMPLRYRIVAQYCMSRCLSMTERTEEASSWAKQLRKTATQLSDSWYRSEADLLSGIICDSEGNHDEALRYFEQAAVRAKRNRHHLIHGHALNNMVPILANSDPDKAQDVLKESIRIKQSVGDDTKLGEFMGLGHLAASSKQFRLAQQYFARAVKIATKSMDDNARAIAEYNLACSLFDQKLAGQALAHLRTVKALAEHLQLHALYRNAVHVEASSFVHLKKYKRAEMLYRKSYDLETKAGEKHAAVIALHNIGAMKIHQHQYVAAREAFEQSEVLAESCSDDEWMYFSARHQAFSHRDDGDLHAALKTFERKIKKYSSAKRFRIAARLAEDLTYLWLMDETHPEQILAAYQLQIDNWSAVKGEVLTLWNRLGELHRWQWQHGYFTEGISSLKRMILIAEKANMKEQHCRAVDQLGTCNQEMRDYEAAEQNHREALRIAKKIKNQALQLNSLNNLGELFRKTSKLQMAFKCYKAAEEIAGKLKDQASAISLAHNRALVLRDMGKSKAGLSLLKRCKRNARTARLWNEFARAQLGIANETYRSLGHAKAEVLYRRAIRTAQKHNDTENLWQAQLNLGGLYGATGKLLQAIGLLEQASMMFQKVPDGGQHYAYLAECYEGAGLNDKAEQAWADAMRMAEKVGDAITLRTAKLGHAVARGRNLGFETVELSFKEMLNSFPEEEKVAVCRSAVELAIESKNLMSVNDWAGKLHNHAKRGRDSEDQLDAYMLIADALWEHTEHRTTAAKYIMMAQVSGYEISIEEGSKACMHLLMKLRSLDQHARDNIHSELEKWLRKDSLSANTKRLLKLMFFPFGLLKRLNDNGELTQKQIQNLLPKLIDQELFPVRAK